VERDPDGGVDMREVTRRLAAGFERHRSDRRLDSERT
jgi:hypothetical protein